MILKIFAAPVDVEAFNELFNSSIVSSSQVTQDGSIYLFYKPLTEIGYSKIDKIQDMEKGLQTKEARLDATLVTHDGYLKEIEEIKTKKNEFHANQAEWKELDDKEKMLERQLKMDKDTIESSNKDIAYLKAAINKEIETLDVKDSDLK